MGAFYLRSKAQWCEIVLCSPRELCFSTSTIGLRCSVGKRNTKKGGESPIGPIAARFEVSFSEEDVSALEESIIPFQTAFKNSNCECQ